MTSSHSFTALSLVAPSGDLIRTGQKRLEVRRWAPPTLPLRDLLIVQNHRRLGGTGPSEDLEGIAVALVDVAAVHDWQPDEVRAAGAKAWEPGWSAWELTNVRPLHWPHAVTARLRLYGVNLAHIRPARLADAPAIARIHVETWRSAYRNIIPAAHLDSLSIEHRTAGWEKGLRDNGDTVLVAEVAGTVIGWVAFGRCRDRGETGEAEIYAIYVDAAHQRAGLGRTLLREAERALNLILPAAKRLSLWVLARNEPACRFYRGLGYRPGPGEKQALIGEELYHEVRYEKASGVAQHE